MIDFKKKLREARAKKLVIEPNEGNGGRQCYFSHKGKDYWADMTDFGNEALVKETTKEILGYDVEVMIFPANGREIESYSDLACYRTSQDNFTDEYLKECITEFMEDIDHES